MMELSLTATENMQNITRVPNAWYDKCVSMINTTWLYEKQSTTITQEVLSVGVRLHWIWGLSVDVRPLEAKADMAEQNALKEWKRDKWMKKKLWKREDRKSVV